MIMFAPIIMTLNNLKATAPADTSALYNKIANLTIVTWIFYPVVWLAAEGSNSLAPDKEALAYTVLDVLAKSVFGFIIISAARSPPLPLPPPRPPPLPLPRRAAPCFKQGAVLGRTEPPPPQMERSVHEV